MCGVCGRDGSEEEAMQGRTADATPSHEGPKLYGTSLRTRLASLFVAILLTLIRPAPTRTAFGEAACGACSGLALGNALLF